MENKKFIDECYEMLLLLGQTTRSHILINLLIHEFKIGEKLIKRLFNNGNVIQNSAILDYSYSKSIIIK